jgi:hypothetical protein
MLTDMAVIAADPSNDVEWLQWGRLRRFGKAS